MTDLSDVEYDAYLAALTECEGVAGLEAECERMRRLVKDLERADRAADDRLDTIREAGYSLSGLMTSAEEAAQIAIQSRKLACSLLEEEVKFLQWDWSPGHHEIVEELKAMADRYERLGIKHGRLVNGKLHDRDPEYWTQLGPPKKEP